MSTLWQKEQEHSGSWQAIGHQIVPAARAEALFASDLSTDTEVTEQVVSQAIARAVRRCGGIRRCAELLAFEYGQHPETAVARMTWAVEIIISTYGPNRVVASVGKVR